MARFGENRPSMGKSLELLGLASFNVLIAMILSVTFLSNVGGKMDRLTEASVRDFIVIVSDISAGKKTELDQYSITSFFMKHISPSSIFETTLRYSIPDTEDDERKIKMDKMTFISHTLQGMDTMKDRETMVKIESIDIADTGQTAAVTTTNYERGLMPIDDGSGMLSMMPVQGISYCEQKVLLNDQQIIQMGGAVCSSELSFSEGF